MTPDNDAMSALNRISQTLDICDQPHYAPDIKTISTALQRSAEADAPISTYTAKYTALCERLRQPVDQGGYDGHAKDPWYCGIADRIEQLEIDLGTQMTMHGAWRKRGEQAEAEFITLKAQVDGLVTALEWYAGDGKNRDFKIVDDKGSYLATLPMFGDRAKEALKQFSAKEI